MDYITVPTDLRTKYRINMRCLQNIFAVGSLLMTAVNALPEDSHTILQTGGVVSTTLICGNDDAVGICEPGDNYFKPTSSVVAHGSIPGRFEGTLTFDSRYAGDKIKVTIGLVDTVLATSTIDPTARDVDLSWDNGGNWISLMEDGTAAESPIYTHESPDGIQNDEQTVDFIIQFGISAGINDIHFGRLATDLSIKVRSTDSNLIVDTEKDLFAVGDKTITLVEDYKLASYTPPETGDYTFTFLATADTPVFDGTDATAWYSKTSLVKPHDVSIQVVDTRYTFGSTDDIDATQTVEKVLNCVLQANRKPTYQSSSFFAPQTLSQDCTISERSIEVDSNGKRRLKLTSAAALAVLEFELGVGNPKRKYFTGSTGCNDESCVGALQLTDQNDVIASTQGVDWAHEAEKAITADVGYSIQKRELVGLGFYLSDATVALSELFTFATASVSLLDLDSTIQFDAPTVTGGVTLKDCPSIAAKAIYDFTSSTQLDAQASTAFGGCEVEEAAAPYKVAGQTGSVVTLSDYLQSTDQDVASSEIFYRASEINTALAANAVGQVKYDGSAATNDYLAEGEGLNAGTVKTTCMSDGAAVADSECDSTGLVETSFGLSTTLQDYIMARPSCELTAADLSDSTCKLPLSSAGTLSDASHVFRNGIERKLCKTVTNTIEVGLELIRRDLNVIEHVVLVTKEYKMDKSSTIPDPDFTPTLTAKTAAAAQDRTSDIEPRVEVNVKYYGFNTTAKSVTFDTPVATRNGDVVSLATAQETMTCGEDPFVVTYQYVVDSVCDSAPGTLTVTQEVDFKYKAADLAISIEAADLSVGITEKELFEQSHMNGKEGIEVTLNRASTSGKASEDTATSDGLSRLRVKCKDPLECLASFGKTWLDCPNGVCTVKYVDKGVYTSPTDDTRYKWATDNQAIPFVLEFGIKHSAACDSTESIQDFVDHIVTFQVSDSAEPFKGAVLLARPYNEENTCNVDGMVKCESFFEVSETPHETTFPSSHVVLESYIDDLLPKGHVLYPVWESSDAAASLEKTKNLELTFTKPAGTESDLFQFSVKVGTNIESGPELSQGNTFTIYLGAFVGENLCHANDLAYGAPINDETLTVEIYKKDDYNTARTFEIKLLCGAGPMNLMYANTLPAEYVLPLEGQYQRIPESGSLARDEFNSFALKLRQFRSLEPLCGPDADQDCAFKNPRPANITIASKINNYLESTSNVGGAIGVASDTVSFVEYTAQVCTTDVPMEIVLTTPSFPDKTFNFKVRCVRNTLDGGATQIEDEVSLDYRIASFVYGKDTSTLNFYRDPVKWSSNTAHVDSQLWFGTCNDEDGQGHGYGAKADCTIATAVGAKTNEVFNKTAGAMLKLINTCGAVANTDDTDKFSSKVTVARKYKRGTEYDNAEFCGESALTLEVVKIGTATAQIAVAAALEVDFQVFIKELEWETCSYGGSDGYKMVMKVMNKYDADGVNVATTNYVAFDTTTAVNILSNYASSLSGTGTTYTHGETGVIVIAGNCNVGTTCTDFGGDDGETTVTSYVLQQKVGNNYYAAPISLTANMQCPLGDADADAESIEVEVACTIGVGETGAACNTAGIDAESIFQLAIPDDDGHGFTLKVVEIRITIGNEAESTLVQKDSFGDLIQAPMPFVQTDGYYENGVHLYAQTMAGQSVTVTFTYSRETQRRLRTLNLASSSSTSFYVLPASIMEQTNAEEAPATAAAAIQQEIHAAGEDVVLQNSDKDSTTKAKTTNQHEQDTAQGWVIATSVGILVVGILVLMFLRYNRSHPSVVSLRSKRAGYTAAVGGRFQSRIQF